MPFWPAGLGLDPTAEVSGGETALLLSCAELHPASPGSADPEKWQRREFILFFNLLEVTSAYSIYIFLKIYILKKSSALWSSHCDFCCCKPIAVGAFLCFSLACAE